MDKRKVEIFLDNKLVEIYFKDLKEGDVFLLDGFDKVIYTATEDSFLSEDGIWKIGATLSLKEGIKPSIVN